MAYTTQHPINFTPEGDTVSEAFDKHIKEFANVYNSLDDIHNNVENELHTIGADVEQLQSTTSTLLTDVASAQKTADEGKATAEQATTRIENVEKTYAPLPSTSAGLGQTIAVNTNSNVFTLPPEGKWFIFLPTKVHEDSYLMTTSVYIGDDLSTLHPPIGVFDGGTKVTTSSQYYTGYFGFIWRVA